ncbi:hypothetical protein [Chitinophaga barathri]|uniref:6-bladed beta-propeller n=1 Tax=Chitinophaga barathri TaxID=1647451 RepID=A0A3N4M7A5_9BACT|nr:hypothetical protein [Chitinophaga barathri]RPD39231.1 hypothetical protein EG028_21715 [Chitinophaga barathri]
MKKLLPGILFICVAVTGLFIVLVSSSDKPGITRTAVNRDYNRVTASPADTLQMPGEIHLLAAYGSIVYALDRRAGILYQTSPHKTAPGIVARPGLYFTEMPASLQADSTGIYCFAANKKKIFRFPLNGGPPDSLSAAALPFSRCARLPDGTVFTHLYDSAARKARFVLADYRNGGNIISHLHDLPHTDDGGLASDGIALPAMAGRQILYVQYHNSDVYRWQPPGLHTFQTIDRTPAENTIIKGDNTWSISSKTQFINIDAATEGDYLYVLSLAVSHNLPTAAPEVDIYHLPGGEYTGSLRLPSFKKSGVRHIAVANGILYAAHSQHIIAYQLSLP